MSASRGGRPAPCCGRCGAPKQAAQGYDDAVKSRADAALTPGESGLVRVERDVSWATQRAVYRAYGVPWWKRLGYTIDHLVPLSLHGTNNPANLWAMPRAQAKVKCIEEASLHRAVEEGRLSRAAARRTILYHWGAKPKRRPARPAEPWNQPTSANGGP